MGALRKMRQVQTKMGKFGEWLQEARKILGLTQAQLAEQLSVHVGAIKRWEYERRMPKASRLKKLSSLLQQEINSAVKSSKIDLSHVPKDKLSSEAQEQIAAITQEAEEVSNKITGSEKAIGVSLFERLVQNQLLYLSFLNKLKAHGVS